MWIENTVFAVPGAEIEVGAEALERSADTITQAYADIDPRSASDAITQAYADIDPRSADTITQAYADIDPDLRDAMNQGERPEIYISVSWQKRGFTSLHGAGTSIVIDVLTGLVVDFVVLYKYCPLWTLLFCTSCHEYGAVSKLVFYAQSAITVISGRYTLCQVCRAGLHWTWQVKGVIFLNNSNLKSFLQNVGLVFLF